MLLSRRALLACLPLLPCALLMPCGASAAPENRMGKSVAQYGRDVEYYYQNPRPAVLAGMLRVMDAANVFSAPDKRLTLAAFFAEIFRRDSAQEALLRKESLSAEALRMLDEAASLTGTRGRPETLPPLLTRDILQDATRISMCWAGFGASGDVRYVDKIIAAAADFARRNAAGLPQDLRFRVGQEAARTLYDYARRHPLVMRRCVQARATADPAAAEMLRRVVEG